MSKVEVEGDVEAWEKKKWGEMKEKEKIERDDYLQRDEMKVEDVEVVSVWLCWGRS